MAEDAAATSSDGASLETIIVTAQKRSENIQTVPISVSAVTGAAIESAHTLNLEALTGSVPNVQIGHFSNTPTSAVFNIRGMGVIEPDPYAGQTVSVVVDGVPQVFNMTSLPDLFDIERIEVLRGPQGTLFGANTTGGVVNIVTRQPTGVSEGRAVVSVGNYNRLDADLALDFPIIADKLAGKIAAVHHSENGWITNVWDGSSMGDQNVTGLRGYLKWTATDNFDATLIQQIDYGNNGAPVVVAGDLPGEAEYVAPGTRPSGSLLPMYASPCQLNQPCRAPDEYFSANNSVADKDKFQIYATTLTMNWKSPIGDITSITGYKRFNEDNYTDQDGTPIFLDDTRRITSGYQLTQEVRDAFKVADNFRLMVGAYLSYDAYKHEQNFRIQFAFPGFHQITKQDQIRRSYSLFAQGDIDLTEKLKLQAGVRATRETTRMVVNVANRISATGQAVFYGDELPPNIDAGGFTAAPPAKSWSNVGGKIGLSYQFTDRIMGYGYVARGFKSGGFTGRIALPSSIGPYDPEYVNTVEAGLKADWLDNRLRTNVSVFYNKYKELQLSQIIFTSINGVSQNDNTIINAANATTKGVELEITAVPVRRLNVNVAVAYLDAKYSRFFYTLTAPAPGSIPCPDIPTAQCLDLKGKALQNAPKITASAGFNYEVPIGASLLSFGVQDRYTDSKYFTSLLNTPRSKIQSMNYIDANVGWKPSEDAKFDVSVWGRNVTDKRYIASVFDAPGTLGLVNYMPPREFGMTVNYKW